MSKTVAEDLRIYHGNCQSGGIGLAERVRGVAICVPSFLLIRVVHQSEELYCGRPEHLMVEVFTKSFRLLIAVVYKPPHWVLLSGF